MGLHAFSRGRNTCQWKSEWCSRLCYNEKFYRLKWKDDKTDKTESTTTLSCGRCTKTTRFKGTKPTAMRKGRKAGWGTETLTGKDINPLASDYGDAQSIIEVMLCPQCMAKRAITSGDYKKAKARKK